MKRLITLSALLVSVLLASGCACKHPWFHKAPAAPPCGPCAGGGAPPPGAYGYPPPVAPAVPPPNMSNLGPSPDLGGMPAMPYHK
jgi:hypothetical protein